MTVIKELSEPSLNNYEDCCKNSPADGCKDRHNNKINNKKDGGIGAACAAPPPELKNLINKFKEGSIKGIDARKLIDYWYEVELRKLSSCISNEEYEERKNELEKIGRVCYDITYGRRENF